jgi:hydroxymethylbilane synthase
VIRLGTRGSALALAQAGEVAEGLRARGVEVEIVAMHTEGDRLVSASLARVGGKGLFVREIDEALLAARIDVAVHSLKDLPAERPGDVCLAALPPRGDPRDVLIARGGERLEDLAPGAAVGTSSPRRRALVLAARPDLAVEPLRGNVDTRLRKLEAGACAAIILAAAGLRRLGIAPGRAEVLDPDVFVPAVGQGIIAVEARAGDGATRAALAALDDRSTRACAEAERAFLRRLGASCNSPLGAHATMLAGGQRLRLTAVIAAADGHTVLRAHREGAVARAEAVGAELAAAMLARGAAGVAPLHPAVGGAG